MLSKMLLIGVQYAMRLLRARMVNGGAKTERMRGSHRQLLFTFVRTIFSDRTHYLLFHHFQPASVEY
jgi:hypothetical protein